MSRRKGWVETASLANLRRLVDARPDEVVEISIAENFRRVAYKQFRRVFFPHARGIIGMEVRFRGEIARFAPTHMIATNLGFDRALDRFLEERDANRKDFAADGHLLSFTARQYLLPPGDKDSPLELFRGATLVDAEASSDEDRATKVGNGIGQWMLSNLSPDGALPYKYWPSRGEESPADNAIRRFLASISLARLGALQGSVQVIEAAQKNLRFNLHRYFKEIDGGRGAIVESTGAKLGAAAVAGLAILESPAKEAFSRELSLLAAGINSLVHEEYGFRTFFFPTERDGQNWNFYSGEALLFWSEAARRGLSIAPSIERCVNTFECCRKWHLRKRNPAFVPWHTQACVSLYAQTRCHELADFVFRMNDWLLPMQQWDKLDTDLRGRFYDPRRPDFGPPHAASTGAYLEGLADAASLARELGEEGRARLYERSIHRGLRSLRQLQFRDHRDAFYVSQSRRVLGALRTEAYDNSVRVDSAAHALMATIKVLHPMQFDTCSSESKESST